VKDNYALRVLLIQIYRVVPDPKMYANAYILARNPHGMCRAPSLEKKNFTQHPSQKPIEKVKHSSTKRPKF
jgi:hypothetical protein